MLRALPCTLPYCQVLDPQAGDWDLAMAERLIKLALWCCMHNPDHRPAIHTVHKDIARMATVLQQQGRLAPEGPLQC